MTRAITAAGEVAVPSEVAPGIVLRVLRSAVSQRIGEPDEEPENTDVTAAPGIEEDEI